MPQNENRKCLNASMPQCLNASMPQCLNASIVSMPFSLCLNASIVPVIII